MENVSLASFEQLSVIGKGSYAKVILSRHLQSHKLYALKILKKKQLQKTRQQSQAMTQRTILCKLSHPFIVHLHSTFQTDQKLYFVLDYCPGGELFNLLTKRKRITEEQARFYAGQLVLALEYLHANAVVYRDLKPENVLIDKNGYVKLTDFGLSSELGDNGELEKGVMCGTPEYLAPQVVKKTAHGIEVDWWALGCLIYEMVVGKTPFESKNRGEMFSKIVNEQPHMPVYLSFKLKSLLQGLLCKSPSNRLTSSQIRSHPWFEKLDFDALLSFSVNPPFLPKIKNDLDLSNFETEFTQCEVDSFGENTESGQVEECYSGFGFGRRGGSVDGRRREH